MYLQRTLKIDTLLEHKSMFLFGPRSTGKTSLIKHQLSDKALVVNLLNSQTYVNLSNKPWELEGIIATKKNSDEYVVIDEIQRVPELLNEVHRLIEERAIKFLLTGSSARKLRQSGVNLLAGRAWKAELFPLTANEIVDFNLDRYLLHGGLPQVYLSTKPVEELNAYVDTYLKEEIQAESFIRKLQSFIKFLQAAALTSGQILNYASLSSDVEVPASTLREYYSILEDTLLGFTVPAWNKSVKRKALSKAKFYLFDIGVRNILVGTESLDSKTDAYGYAFEHFIAIELRAHLSYFRTRLTLSYWQAKNGQEVDFIVGDHIAIEVKTTNQASSKHLKGLHALQEENICKKFYLVCFDQNHRIVDGVEIIHWRDFIKLLKSDAWLK